MLNSYAENKITPTWRKTSLLTTFEIKNEIEKPKRPMDGIIMRTEKY